MMIYLIQIVCSLKQDQYRVEQNTIPIMKGTSHLDGPQIELQAHPLLPNAPSDKLSLDQLIEKLPKFGLYERLFTAYIFLFYFGAAFLNYNFSFFLLRSDDKLSYRCFTSSTDFMCSMKNDICVRSDIVRYEHSDQGSVLQNWITRLGLECVDSYKIGLFGTLSFCGEVMSNFVLPPISDKYGRKFFTILGSTIQLTVQYLPQEQAEQYSIRTSFIVFRNKLLPMEGVAQCQAWIGAIMLSCSLRGSESLPIQSQLMSCYPIYIFTFTIQCQGHLPASKFGPIICGTQTNFSVPRVSLNILHEKTKVYTLMLFSTSLTMTYCLMPFFGLTCSIRYCITYSHLMELYPPSKASQISAALFFLDGSLAVLCPLVLLATMDTNWLLLMGVGVNVGCLGLAGYIRPGESVKLLVTLGRYDEAKGELRRTKGFNGESEGGIEEGVEMIERYRVMQSQSNNEEVKEGKVDLKMRWWNMAMMVVCWIAVCYSYFLFVFFIKNSLQQFLPPCRHLCGEYSIRFKHFWLSSLRTDYDQI